MLQKQFLACFFLVFFLASCQQKSELIEALQPTYEVAKPTLADIISNQYDQLIYDELAKQQVKDSTRYIVKVHIYDKELYAFPIKKSPRLDHHIYRFKNEDEVFRGLRDNIEGFHDSRFNKDLGIAKMYFETNTPDSSLQKFLKMCVFENYQIVELK